MMTKPRSGLASNIFLFISIICLSLSTLFNSNMARAVPAFARQTDMSCTGCHFQSYPALNAFGRIFRAGGYTLSGSQKKIEGDNNLSMPGVLNASIIMKLRYQLDDQVDDNRGEIQWPDEAAILVGGRASEKIGFLMELGQGPVGAGEAAVDPNGNTISDYDKTSLGGNGDGVVDPAERTAFFAVWDGDTEGETHGTFLSTKFHFKVGDEFAIIPFSTDGLGVGYGFELLNTGAQRSQRPIENRKGFSAGQALGTASGEATGIAFIYQTPEWFVNYSHWTPTWGNAQVNIFGGLANYFRAVYMPNIGGWDTGFGVSAMSGSIESGPTNPAATTYVDGWTIDAQAQGDINGTSLGIYTSYGVAPKSSATEPNHYNSSTTEDETAFGMVAKAGVIPGKTQVYAGYASHDNNATEIKTNTIGVQQMLAQNIKLEFYSVNSDSANAADDFYMLMLFAGF
jgi:hypothetical protein